MTKLLSSLVLTPPLFLVALICFYWGNNAHMYEADSIAASFLALVIAAAVLAAIGCAARFCWNRLGGGGHWAGRLVAGLAVGGLTVALMNTVIRDLMRSVIPSEFSKDVFRIAVLLIFFALAFLRLRRMVRVLNIFFMASACLSMFMAASVFLNEDSGAGNGLNAPSGASSTDDGFSVSLKKTPNIYLFWMESFSEFRLIDEHYGTNLVQGGFLDELREKGFQYFENTYANSNCTLLSMADFFTMRLDQNRGAGVLDVKPPVRRLIGGNNDNRVLKILKDNGYFTSFITYTHPMYHGGQIGGNLDSTDFVIPAGSMQYYLRPLWELDPRRMSERFGVAGEYSGTTLERVRHAMRLAENNGKPLFISFKGGAHHTALAGYSYLQSAEWVPEYHDSVEKGISLAREIIDMIVGDDLGAVIILLGDHGPWRLRGLDGNTDNDIQKFKAQVQRNNGSIESFVDDIFNVMLAIRIPGYEDDISHGLPMTTVNIFRHILAALNDDPAILESRQPSISTYNRMTLAVDGKIIQ